ncbi:MAG: hypothetical protein Q9193_006026, partial [Seirophora villosa]
TFCMMCVHARLTELREDDMKNPALAKYDRLHQLDAFDGYCNKVEFKDKVYVNDFPPKHGLPIQRRNRRVLVLDDDSDAEVGIIFGRKRTPHDEGFFHNAKRARLETGANDGEDVIGSDTGGADLGDRNMGGADMSDAGDGADNGADNGADDDGADNGADDGADNGADDDGANDDGADDDGADDAEDDGANYSAHPDENLPYEDIVTDHDGD